MFKLSMAPQTYMDLLGLQGYLVERLRSVSVYIRARIQNTARHDMVNAIIQTTGEFNVLVHFYRLRIPAD